MNTDLLIAKLTELKEKVGHQEEEREQDQSGDLDNFVQKVEGVRKSIESMATALGVTVRPDSLAVPVPIEVLANIVERLISLEDRAVPAVEFIEVEANNPEAE
jgi:hypothetical protein